jgi:hypothetical protein
MCRATDFFVNTSFLFFFVSLKTRQRYAISLRICLRSFVKTLFRGQKINLAHASFKEEFRWRQAKFLSVPCQHHRDYTYIEYRSVWWTQIFLWRRHLYQSNNWQPLQPVSNNRFIIKIVVGSSKVECEDFRIDDI